MLRLYKMYEFNPLAWWEILIVVTVGISLGLVSGWLLQSSLNSMNTLS
jgi:hypothetical protein